MATKKDSTNVATVNQNKEKAVKNALAAMQKKYGKETINVYGDSGNTIDVIHEPTGSIASTTSQEAVSHAAESTSSMAPRVLARRPSHSRRLPKCRRKVGWRRSSTSSTHSIPSRQHDLA